ncbi:MAG: hypothetical protein JHC26_01635 [Thermofilum sp.]|jgi:hypothetical protein|uniref:hypothetical protein n=1 Tax=Thermofilum sp. TaxID=1961369 RepID=UPI002590FF26|nr:hypothetical protein [Thermofilum sp.]MCI4407763.1 hypothetical protein [Thermofilum sp.]
MMLEPINSEIINISKKVNSYGATTEFALRLEMSVTASLILISLMIPDSARYLALFHAMMDVLLTFYLFIRYLGLLKYVKEHKMEGWLKEPPLSYAPYLNIAIPLAFFIGNLFSAFSWAPTNNWLVLLIGYNAVLLGIVATLYHFFDS